jgi:hypothetical protein
VLRRWVAVGRRGRSMLMLDALIVVPLANLSFAVYLEQIGLVYLIIPTLTMVLLRRSSGQRRLKGHIQA